MDGLQQGPSAKTLTGFKKIRCVGNVETGAVRDEKKALRNASESGRALERYFYLSSKPGQTLARLSSPNPALGNVRVRGLGGEPFYGLLPSTHGPHFTAEHSLDLSDYCLESASGTNG